MPVLVRDSRNADVPAVAAIYAHWVLHGLPSIGLHRACGFRPAGVLPAVGWKHGRWVDSVLMTRPLGPSANAPPPEGW